MRMRVFISSRFVIALALWCTTLHTVAQSPLDQAKEAYAAADYAKALSAADLQIEQQPSGEAYMMRADCLQKLGEYTRALDDYDRAKSMGYEGTEFYMHRGICKISAQLFESARQDLVTYLQKNEADAKGYYWLAVVEYMSMENRACQRYIDEAIYLDSTYAEAYYLRAANYVDTKKNLLALEDFQMAFSLQPALLRAKLNMAVILLDMGQYKSSLEMLTELKAEKSDCLAEALYYHGEALYFKHDMEGACGDWVEAAELGDDDAEAMYKKLCIDKNDKPRFKRRTYFQF
ncbi:MAG: tetratricopeptide repeat protein [Flavobacteriales bacterium]